MENLTDALRYFRAKSETRTLWADSVCINQQDNDEKWNQVGMMAEIYKIACNLLIWLDTETPDTERPFAFIRRLTEKKKAKTKPKF